MTNKELIKLLQAGKVDEFNQFRAENPDFIPNFEDALLYTVNLNGANLAGANLSRANLSRSYLIGANLVGANLTGVNLICANCAGAIFDKQQIAMLPELLGIEIIED